MHCFDSPERKRLLFIFVRSSVRTMTDVYGLCLVCAVCLRGLEWKCIVIACVDTKQWIFLLTLDPVA